MAANNKERIKDRMQKTAARLWGIPENEIETNFDPLVQLLIEACAAELEKVGDAINTSQDRLLEKLADLIVPEAVVGPKPASTVAVATPLENSVVFNKQTSFFSQEVFDTASNSKRFSQNIFFTPIGDFLALKSKLAYVMIGQKWYKLNANGPRELMYSAAGNNNQTKVNELWLAISPDKNLASLKGLSIYFDMRSHSTAPFLYSSLAQTKAWLGDKEIRLGQGYENQYQFELLPESMLVQGHDYANKINRQLAGVYEQQFLHFAEGVPTEAMQLPAQLAQLLPTTVVQKLAAEPMMYIKLVLGRYFTQEDIDGLAIHINAFPVVNRTYHTQFYRTDPWVNIIPIQVAGHFLDVHSIQSATGSSYKFRVSADQQMLDEGEALIRSSGVGKTNSREVRDIIANLMDAIRDESAYFSETSNDFIVSRLKEISQILSRLDDQMQKSKDTQAAHYYILLKPKTAGETITINYWTTDGTLANQVNAGTVLQPNNHTLTGNKDAYLVGTANGGRDRTSDNEKKSLLKQQIISKGKIISAYDIKMLCHQIFGNNLQQVKVEKGTGVGATPSEGFFKVIKVMLTLKDKTAADTAYLCKQLETTLKNEATYVYPFQITVE